VVVRSAIVKLSILGLLLVVSCSQKPRMRFNESWKGDLKEVWMSSKTTLNYESFGEDEVGKYFVVTIRGRLPLGELSLNAIEIKENGERVTAEIYPESIENDDPKADLFALKVYSLLTKDDIKANVREFIGAFFDSDFRFKNLKSFSKGRFYIYLEKNGEEIVGNELTIR